MKRARIMLSAIALLAVIGGTVAFKSKMDLQPYCIAAPSLLWGISTCTDQAGLELTCQDWVEGVLTEELGYTLCYREPDIILWCSDLNCYSLTQITLDD